MLSIELLHNNNVLFQTAAFKIAIIITAPEQHR